MNPSKQIERAGDIPKGKRPNPSWVGESVILILEMGFETRELCTEINSFGAAGKGSLLSQFSSVGQRD